MRAGLGGRGGGASIIARKLSAAASPLATVLPDTSTLTRRLLVVDACWLLVALRMATPLPSSTLLIDCTFVLMNGALERAGEEIADELLGCGCEACVDCGGGA